MRLLDRFPSMALGVCLVLAGCGGDDDGTTPRDAGADTGTTDGGMPDGETADAGGEDGGAPPDGGPTCTPSVAHPISTVSATSNARAVSLVATDTGYAAAWHDTIEGSSQILFVRLDTSGTPIGTELRVTNGEGASASPSLVWNGTEYAIAWYDDRDGNTEIYFTRVSAEGIELGDDVRVTTDAARSEFPSLAWNGTGYGVAWNDTRDGSFRIYMVSLEASGARLGEDTLVSLGMTGIAASPRVVWDGAGYGAVWHDTRDMMGLQIYLGRLGPSGTPLGLETPLSGAGASEAMGGGNAMIAWSGMEYGIAFPDDPAMGGEIYFAIIDAGGAIARLASPATSTMGTARAASVAARTGGWALAWSDSQDGDAEIRFQQLDGSGAPFGTEVPLSNDDTASIDPSVVVGHGGFAAAWVDATSDTTASIRFAKICL